MKKYLFLLGLMAMLNFIVFAQATFVIQDTESNDIGNTIVEINSNDNINEHVNGLNIINPTGSALNLKVKKTELSMASGSRIYFCVGITCYPPFSFSSNPFSIQAGGSLNYPDGFAAHFEPLGYYGNSEIMFTFMNNDNPGDSLTVTYKYNIENLNSGSAIEKVSKARLYPNPSSNLVKLEYQFPSNNNNFLVLHNMLGSEMKRIPITDISGRLEINIADLKPGIYFYSIIENGLSIKTSRLVINR